MRSWAAGGVVVVAEGLVLAFGGGAEAGALAAVAGDEDVAALLAGLFGLAVLVVLGLRGHVCAPPPGVLICKVLLRKELGGDFVST